MNAPIRLPTVQRLGPGRVRITGDITDSLRDWLSARREVVEVREREGVGAIEVRFHDDLDGAPRGTFARALDDHLHLMVRPVREPFGVAVVHALPGRVRLAVRGLSRDDDLARLARWVSERPGVLRAHASPAGGTIVVQFDPATLDAAALLDAVRTSDRARWPDDAPPKQRDPGVVTRRSRSRSSVAARMNWPEPARPSPVRPNSRRKTPRRW